MTLVVDGCSWIKKTGEFLVTHYGLMSPTTHCSAIGGSIKCIATSKTMCIEEIVNISMSLIQVESTLFNNTFSLVGRATPFSMMLWQQWRSSYLKSCNGVQQGWQISLMPPSRQWSYYSLCVMYW